MVIRITTNIQEEIHSSLFSIAKKKRESSVYHMPSYHYHSSYEIYYLLDGQRYYFIKDRRYKVQKGSLILLDSNEIHRTLNWDDPRHTKIMIQFDGSFLKQFFKGEHIHNMMMCFKGIKVLTLDLKQQYEVESLLLQLISENEIKHQDQSLYISSMLSQLLLTVKRYQENPTCDYKSDYSLHSKIEDILTYINANYSQDLTLQCISQHFFISPNYLCKIFKDTTGFTYINYLNQVRIQSAQELLRNSDLNINSISCRVGFKSTTHFGRVFKNIVHLSPLQYRKLCN